MGNASSSSVYNESFREISRHPPPPTSPSIYSYSTVTSYRTNRSNMSTLSRKRKEPKHILVCKARYLGRFYMRHIGEATLLKVQQHTKTIKGIKSKLKLSAEGLYTGYKQSSLVRTHVPPSFIPLMKIYRLEVDKKYDRILYCAQKTADNNLEVLTYRMRLSGDALHLKRTFRDVYASAVGRDLTFGVRDIVLSPDDKQYTYAKDDDSDNESNWTLKADTTLPKRLGMNNSKSTENIYSSSNGTGMRSRTYSSNTAVVNRNATMTRADEVHHKDYSHLEREMNEMSHDLKEIKHMFTAQQSSQNAVMTNGGRSVSAASNYPASISTNDSGFNTELVAAGPGVVKAYGGSVYQQQLQNNAKSRWKSETALLADNHSGTNSNGTTVRIGSNAVQGHNGISSYHTSNGYATHQMGVPNHHAYNHGRQHSFVPHSSSTMGHIVRKPSAASTTVLHAQPAYRQQAMMDRSVSSASYNQTSTLGRPNFALVYPHTPTSVRRQRTQSTDRW